MNRRLMCIVANLSVVALLGLTAGCAGSKNSTAEGSGSVTLGVPAALTGSGSVIGQGAVNGIKLAVGDLNAKGGVLGHQVHLDVADDAGSAATALTLTRRMITQNNAVAILGSSTSSTAAAEASLARQYNLPLLLWGGNDSSLTARPTGSNTFILQPSTKMEPVASAEYLSKKPGRRYYFIAPDYSFGHDTVAGFKSAMAKLGTPVTDLGEQYVPIGQGSYSSYVAAALAAKPDVIYTLLFGTDEVNLIKEAYSYGIGSTKTKIAAILGTDLEASLGAQMPAGIYLEDRAPFEALNTPASQKMANEYHAKYGAWPTEWALLGYSSVQVWAQAAKKSGSVSGQKVMPMLSKTTFQTVRGSFGIRACDNQAVVSDYFWTSSSKLSAYGWPAVADEFKSNASATLPACS